MTADDSSDLNVADQGSESAGQPEGVLAGNGTVAPSGTAAPDEHQDALTDRLRDLTSEVARLTGVVERFHDRAEHLERMNRSMHEEIETLRRGEAQELLKPVINQLADLVIRLRLQSSQLVASMSADEAGKMLEAYLPVVLDILGQLGVESYTPEVGDTFDRITQRAVRRIDSPHPEQDRTVLRVQAPGFILAGADRPLRPAEVHVARFVEKAAAPASGPPDPQAVQERTSPVQDRTPMNSPTAAGPRRAVEPWAFETPPEALREPVLPVPFPGDIAQPFSPSPNDQQGDRA